MTKRSYQQYCPISYSLDLIGERWTLLIIRELWFAPRRFTDILNQLPSIGPNLLSRRLKDLEAAQIIQHRKLPPPAASEIYELTEFGLGLKGVLRELSRWGGQFLPESPPNDDVCGSNIAVITLNQRFNPTTAKKIELTGEIRSEYDVFTVQIHEEKLMVRVGLANQPDFILESNVRPFLALIKGQLSLQMAIEEDLMALIDGDVALVESFLDIFE